MKADVCLAQPALPSFWVHATAACPIVRHNGMDAGRSGCLPDADGA